MEFSKLADLMIEKKVMEYSRYGVTVKLHPSAFIPKARSGALLDKPSPKEATALQKELAQLGLNEEQLAMLTNTGGFK